MITTIHLVKSANVNFATKKGVERLDKGELPGCCHVCPTGAIIFGTREELLAEAKRRLSLLRGTEYDYPRQHVNSKRHLSRNGASLSISYLR